MSLRREDEDVGELGEKLIVSSSPFFEANGAGVSFDVRCIPLADADAGVISHET